MGRKKLDFKCKECELSTELMQKPIYVDSEKSHFCDMDCYKNYQNKGKGKE